MKIKKKNYLSFLITGVILFIFMIEGWIHYDKFDWKAKFGVMLFTVNAIWFGTVLFKDYFTTFTRNHTLRIKNGILEFDKKKYKIDDYLKIKFKDQNISLFIWDKLIFKNIYFDEDEIERFLYIIKPYLKNPKIVTNINFHEIKPFKEGFFIKHKKFYYEKIEKLEIRIHRYYANLEAFDIYITLNNGKTIKKRIRKNKLNEAVILFINFKLAKCEDIKNCIDRG